MSYGIQEKATADPPLTLVEIEITAGIDLRLKRIHAELNDIERMIGIDNSAKGATIR